VRYAPSLLRLHVHVHEVRLHVLHDDERHAHVLRLLLLVASIDDSALSESAQQSAVPPRSTPWRHGQFFPTGFPTKLPSPACGRGAVVRTARFCSSSSLFFQLIFPR
jgi:hypothetical protein